MEAGSVSTSTGEPIARREDRFFSSGAVYATHAFAALIFVLSVWALSVPLVDFGLALTVFAFSALYGIWWCVSVLVILLAAAFRRAWPAPSDVLHAAAGPLVALSVVALYVTDAPLRARFELSRPALTRLVEQGPANPDQDRRAGLYRIESIRAVDGGVHLVTGYAWFCEYGFAYLSRRPARDEPATYRHLSGRWYVWSAGDNSSSCD